MKKKVLLLVLVTFLTFSLTGCTTYLKDDDGKNVREETTGQTLTENILCQPTNKDVIKTYQKNGVDISELPKCDDFNPASLGYSGLWETLFVKPLSWVIIKLGTLLHNYGWAIILVTILIRLIIFPISRKSALQSENMKFAQKDLEKLENKYRHRDSQEDQMLKAQEMMAIYKKYEINPLSGCLFAFIQLPLFLVFLESLNRLPIIFEGDFLGFNLGTTPSTAILSNGNWLYLILPILVALTTFFSFKLNSGMSANSEEQQKQLRMTMNIMLIFIVISSFVMPTSIIVYWITGSLFTIIQGQLIRRAKENGSSKKRIKK